MKTMMVITVMVAGGFLLGGCMGKTLTLVDAATGPTKTKRIMTESRLNSPLKDRVASLEVRMGKAEGRLSNLEATVAQVSTFIGTANNVAFHLSAQDGYQRAVLREVLKRHNLQVSYEEPDVGGGTIVHATRL